ncbi:hypothetical protein PC129_g21411 [Phytophthora cactorum]|uniref:Uncharacterized protein n=1 Tax=Phytophthora cactorum TaxID=29920 RepID=A0A8T1LM81_9STRA|nr:hypothetical protein Pcac1_g22155 [Phytophthora cactorum]KAG3068527.1 hypothetical protein PI125_g23396 [Phytophthora idaei]KAG2767559.1 hypothetical protein Pcac1_g21244 [Phytophthora cactorum]KAG2813788.1 hypothetical protein PC112_g14597 [Phytophthora cactorum]KAG2852780.1 hypothetical protein PC113_g14735 [Phytophthora cactorum]
MSEQPVAFMGVEEAREGRNAHAGEGGSFQDRVAK